MINLFIDTNVCLSFFHLTSEDLEELKKLAGEAAHRAVEIIRSDESQAAPEAQMGGSSELVKEVSPQEIEDRGDDKEPDEEQ